MGSFAVQIARAAGAYVFATARGEAVEVVRSLGAHRVTDYHPAPDPRGDGPGAGGRRPQADRAGRHAGENRAAGGRVRLRPAAPAGSGTVTRGVRGGGRGVAGRGRGHRSGSRRVRGG
ncbi:MAG: hypothetical protein DIU70_000050 [Bacillota bacterium]